MKKFWTLIAKGAVKVAKFAVDHPELLSIVAEATKK